MAAHKLTKEEIRATIDAAMERAFAAGGFQKSKSQLQAEYAEEQMKCRCHE